MPNRTHTPDVVEASPQITIDDIRAAARSFPAELPFPEIDKALLSHELVKNAGGLVLDAYEQKTGDTELDRRTLTLAIGVSRVLMAASDRESMAERKEFWDQLADVFTAASTELGNS